MLKKKKLDVFSDGRTLEITLDWFSPKAYFFGFFSVFWMGILGVMYFIMITGGVPMPILLFPIFHLLAGLGIFYYTLCLFMNKTYLDINDGYLSIINKPIPWWRGNTTIATVTIEQVYVKEKITRTRNGRSKSYELFAKLKDGSHQRLFSLGTLESQELKEIESHIEEFLGIQDAPVSGEFGRTGFELQLKGPRRQRRDFTRSKFNTLYHSAINDSIIFQEESLEVVSLIQHDWDDGNSDKLFQLLNFQKQEKLLHIQQNSALLNVFQHKKLSILEVGNIQFNPFAPVASITYDGVTYLLDRNVKGRKFNSGHSDVIEIEQWLYVGPEGNYVQVLGANKRVEYSHWEKVPDTDVSEGLELRDLEKDEVELRRDLGEEDFV